MYKIRVWWGAARECLLCDASYCVDAIDPHWQAINLPCFPRADDIVQIHPTYGIVKASWLFPCHKPLSLASQATVLTLRLISRTTCSINHEFNLQANRKQWKRDIERRIHQPSHLFSLDYCGILLCLLRLDRSFCV